MDVAKIYTFKIHVPPNKLNFAHYTATFASKPY